VTVKLARKSVIKLQLQEVIHNFMKRTRIILIAFQAGAAFFCLLSAPCYGGDTVIIRQLDPFFRDGYDTRLFLTGDQVVLINSARNEYESARIGVVANKDIGEVELEISELTDGTRRIPRDNIRAKIIKYWYQGEEAWTGRYDRDKQKRKLVPELLLNDETLIRIDEKTKANYIKTTDSYVNISRYGDNTGVGYFKGCIRDAPTLTFFKLYRNKVKQIWIDVKVNANCSPGVYYGILLIKKNKKILNKTKLVVKVHDVILPKPRIKYGVYYRSKLRRGIDTVSNISSEFRNEKQMLKEMILLKENGIEYPTIYQSNTDPELLQKYLRLREAAGISNKTIFYLGVKIGNPQATAVIQRVTQGLVDIKRIFERYGVEKLYVYGIDEAKGNLLQSQIAIWKAVKEKGLRIFVAGYEETPKLVGGMADVQIIAGAPSIRLSNMVHSCGSEIFSYNNPQTAVENPFVYRKNYGFVLWKNKYDGAMPYAFMTSYRNTWNDFDHKYFRDHNLVYPTSDSIIETLALKGYREAIDDVRYLTYLESLAHVADKNKQAIASVIKQFIIKIKRKDEDTILTDMRNSIIYFSKKVHKNGF